MEIGCRLQGAEIEEQRLRHEALACSAAIIEREPRELRVRFDETVDRALLEEMVEVERRCCPFFEIDYADRERTLTLSVGETRMAPALDVVAERLGAPLRSTA